MDPSPEPNNFKQNRNNGYRVITAIKSSMWLY